MRIKKYVAKSMREALIDIKKDLGESAVILKTRKMQGTVFPFGGQDIEVTAAVEDESTPKPAFPELRVERPDPGIYRKPRTSCIIDSADIVEMRPWKPPVLSSAAKKYPVVPKENEGIDTRYQELKEDLKNLTAMVTSALEKGGATKEGEFGGAWSVFYKKLINSEVRPDIAAALIKNLQGGAGAENGTGAAEKMIGLLQSKFPVTGPVKCRKKGPVVVAFTGPTGSGKTTTLAKLVANCRLNKSKKVSIITADTYRIAAIEQIRVFADIVKAELQVVFSPEEVASALSACSGDDLVFVDTAGRSPHDAAHMEELRRYLESLRPDEVHCVVSATTKDSDLREAAERFRAIGADRLLFTKLDETGTVGNIFNTVNTCGMPVSFLTFGQSVPDDIELAQPARFVRRLWEGNAA